MSASTAHPFTIAPATRRWLLPAAATSLTLVAFATLSFLPLDTLSWTGAYTLAATMATVVFLAVVHRVSRTEEKLFHTTLAIWAVGLISEHIFPRQGLSDAIYEGNFALFAYGEVAVWCVATLALAAVALASISPFAALKRSAFRWMAAYAGWCLLASLWSPRPMFAVVWAFKLALLATTVILLARHITTLARLRAFLMATLASVAFATALPLVEAFSHPATAFEWKGFDGLAVPEARLNAILHPVAASELGALLAVLAIVLHRSAPGAMRRTAPLAFMGSFVLLAGAGKTAILGAFLASIAFFLFQKRFKPAALTLTAAALLIGVAFWIMPIGQYFRSYVEADSYGSLSGRTELWTTALDIAATHPLTGHGFVASKFITQAAHMEWDAGQLHNALLETFYNTGLIGLILIVGLQFILVRQLIRGLRSKTNDEPRLAAGYLAIFVLLSVNGLTEPTFGGRPGTYLAILFALCVAANALGNPRRAVPAKAAHIPRFYELQEGL